MRRVEGGEREDGSYSSTIRRRVRVGREGATAKYAIDRRRRRVVVPMERSEICRYDRVGIGVAGEGLEALLCVKQPRWIPGNSQADGYLEGDSSFREFLSEQGGQTAETRVLAGP